MSNKSSNAHENMARILFPARPYAFDSLQRPAVKVMQAAILMSGRFTQHL